MLLAWVILCNEKTTEEPSKKDIQKEYFYYQTRNFSEAGYHYKEMETPCQRIHTGITLASVLKAMGNLLQSIEVSPNAIDAYKTGLALYKTSPFISLFFPQYSYIGFLDPLPAP